MTQLTAISDDLPRKGDLIAGKYQVEEVVGSGGMGVVVAARHVALRQRVAVKFLLPSALRLPEAGARFLREARAAVAIQSEHVARVIDVGTLENGGPYMVMEFLAGTDFSRLLKQRGPLPLTDAVDFLLQAGEAIAEAHRLGIVHRDLKPANLFLTSRPEGSPLVKVLDFGLSKLTLDEEADQSLTATTAVVGSPQYMSPEQIRSLKHVGTGTDIWALGVILHEMLTGHRPFEGRTLTAISASIVADTPPPVRALRPDLPLGIDAVVLACLEKDQSRRVPSVADLAARLAPFASPRSLPSLERIAKLAVAGPAVPPSEALLEAPDDDDSAATRAVITGDAVPSAPAVTMAMPSPAAVPPVSAVLVPGPAPAPPPLSTVPPDAWGQTKPQRPRLSMAAMAAGGLLAIGVTGIAVGAVAWLAFGSRDVPRPAASSGVIASVTVPVPAPVPETPARSGTGTGTGSNHEAAAAPPPPVETAAPVASASASATAEPHPAATSAPRSAPARTAAPSPPRRGGNPLDRSD